MFANRFFSDAYASPPFFPIFVKIKIILCVTNVINLVFFFYIYIWCDWPLRVRRHRLIIILYQVVPVHGRPIYADSYHYTNCLSPTSTKPWKFLYIRRLKRNTDFTRSYIHNFNFRFPPIVMFLRVSRTRVWLVNNLNVIDVPAGEIERVV